MIRYLGTCVDIDQSGDTYGFDPTEFAQAEERAIESNIDLPMEEFWVMAIAPDEIKDHLVGNDKIWYAQDSQLGVSWAYEPDEDIHYIFDGLVSKVRESRLIYDVGQDQDGIMNPIEDE